MVVVLHKTALRAARISINLVQEKSKLVTMGLKYFNIPLAIIFNNIIDKWVAQ